MDKDLILILAALVVLYMVFKNKNATEEETFVDEVPQPLEITKTTNLKDLNIPTQYEYTQKVFTGVLTGFNKLSEAEANKLEEAFNQRKSYPLTKQNDTTIDLNRVIHEPAFIARIQPFIDYINQKTFLKFKLVDLYSYKEEVLDNRKLFMTIISIHDGDVRTTKNLALFGDASGVLYAYEIGKKEYKSGLADPSIVPKLALFDPTILEKVDSNLLDHDSLKLPFDTMDNNRNYRVERLDKPKDEKLNIGNKKLVFSYM